MMTFLTVAHANRLGLESFPWSRPPYPARQVVSVGPDAIEIAASNFASAKINGKGAEGEKYVF
jgi:hypothetical protein